MRISTFAFVAGLSLVSCRSSGDDSGTTDGPAGGNDTGSGSDIGSDGFTKIQAIQSSSMAPGTAVTLGNVVVTAVDLSSSQAGNFWVEEPEGGINSGVLVHKGDPATVQTLVVGDIVTIKGGVKEEFALSTDTSGNTDTEVEPASSGSSLTITKTGTGTVPAPVVVDALMFGQAATGSACDAAPTSCTTNTDWRQYEGVLITVNNVTAGGVSGSVGTQEHFNITGQIDVESTMTGSGTVTGTGSASGFPTFKSGACLASVTGVLDYFFQYNLLPRTTADVTTGGTGCPAKEAAAGTSIGTCGDGTDNDGNGFADCADLGCEVGSGAWLGATCATGDTLCGCSTNTAPGAGVSTANASTTEVPLILHNVVVTAVASGSYWIADSGTAAANHGILVFSSPTGLTVGENLTSIQGIVESFDQGSGGSADKRVEELDDATTVAGTGVAVVTPLSGQTAAALTSLANGSAFAGVVVTLSNIKVTTAADAHNQVKVTDNSGTAFTMDDEAFFGYGGGSGSADLPAVGTCYKTLTGVMDLQTADQVRTINPRSALDMIAIGGACN